MIKLASVTSAKILVMAIHVLEILLVWWRITRLSVNSVLQDFCLIRIMGALKLLDAEAITTARINKLAQIGNVSILVKTRSAHATKSVMWPDIAPGVYQLRQQSANWTALASQIHVNPILAELEPSVRMTKETHYVRAPRARLEILLSDALMLPDVIQMLADQTLNVSKDMVENLNVSACQDSNHRSFLVEDVNLTSFNSAFLDLAESMLIASSLLWESNVNADQDTLAIHSLAAFLLQSQVILAILHLVEEIPFALSTISAKLFALACLECKAIR